jgi:anti-sigma factor RsiW
MLSWRTHPDDENLLRFCEGELLGRQASRVARHLDACWECRTQVDDIRKTIGEYVHYRKDVLQPSLPSPPEPWMDLNRDFQRIRTEQSKRGGWGAILRRPVAWILVGGAVLLASTTVFLNRTDRSARQQLDYSRPAKRTANRPLAEVKKHASDASASTPRLGPVASEPSSVTADDELKVIAALHRISADLGDPIEVVREKNAIVVSSAGLDPERADQLHASLSGIPRVSIRLSAPAPLPAQVDSHTPVVESTQESPLEPQISHRFSNHRAFQKIVDQTLKSSEDMMARAHALRSLADRFPPAVAAQMSPSSLALLNSILREHTAALASNVAAIERSMNPILRSSDATVQPPQRRTAASSSWEELTYQLFSSAATLDHLLGTLLAPAAGTQISDSGPADLAMALAKLSDDLRSYQHLSAGEQKRGLQ